MKLNLSHIVRNYNLLFCLSNRYLYVKFQLCPSVRTIISCERNSSHIFRQIWIFTKCFSLCNLKHIVKVLWFTAASWKTGSSCYILFSPAFYYWIYLNGFGENFHRSCNLVHFVRVLESIAMSYMEKRGLRDSPPSIR